MHQRIIVGRKKQQQNVVTDTSADIQFLYCFQSDVESHRFRRGREDRLHDGGSATANTLYVYWYRRCVEKGKNITKQ